MFVILRKQNNVDIAHPFTPDERDQALKDGTAELVEGIIYRECKPKPKPKAKEIKAKTTKVVKEKDTKSK